MNGKLLVGLLVVLLVAGSAWGQLSQPTYATPASPVLNPLVSPIHSYNLGVEFGIGSQIHLNPGSYFYDEGYRYSDFFVPQTETTFVALASSATTFNFNAYPGWTQYTASSTVTGSVTLTSSAGVDIAVSNVASGMAAVLCKGNVTAYNVASRQPCVFDAKFSVPTLTSTTGAGFVGFASAIGATTSNAPAWSTTATTYGPSQALGFTVTSSLGVGYLGYAVYSATDSRAVIAISSVTVSQSDVFRVRIDATTTTQTTLKYSKNGAKWQTLYTFDASAFTAALQLVISVAKKVDASAIDLRLRYVKVQVLQP